MNQLEAKIRDYLASNLGMLEKGLTLVDTEYLLKNSFGADGRIDILARDVFGNYVIIEIKRSDQAARQAVHELFKYVSIIHRQLGVSQSIIRAMLVSTNWHELAVPFSEFLEVASCHAEGYQIAADADGVVSSVIKFSPVSLNSPLVASRCQSLHLYVTKEKRDDNIAEISKILTDLGIDDHVLFSIDPDGQDERVIYPYGTYVMFSSPFNALNAEKCEELKLRLNWDDDLDSPDENFLIAFCRDFDGHDTMEIGTPEKLRVIEETWDINIKVRAGRFGANQKLLTDNEVLQLTMQTDGGSPHYLNCLVSPKFKERWDRLLEDSSYVLSGNSSWNAAVPMIFEEILKNDVNASVAISIYNIANTHYSLSKMCIGDLRYFPKIEIVSQTKEGTHFYYSFVRWNEKKISFSPERFFKLTCDEPMYWLTAQHFGEQYEFDDLVRSSIGLDTPFFHFFFPVDGEPSSHELIFSDKIIYTSLAELNAAGPIELLESNRAFFAAYRELISGFAAGLFEEM